MSDVDPRDLDSNDDATTETAERGHEQAEADGTATPARRVPPALGSALSVLWFSDEE